jgi:hypothetical protein
MLVVRGWGRIVFFGKNHSGLGSGAGLADSVAAGRQRFIPGRDPIEEVCQLTPGPVELKNFPHFSLFLSLSAFPLFSFGFLMVPRVVALERCSLLNST